MVVDVFEPTILTVLFSVVSIVIFLSFWMVPKKVFRIWLGIATFPSFRTLTGIFISIPRSKLVAFIVKLFFDTSKRIQLSTGSVGFLLVTRSAAETAFVNFSFMHSIFIFLYINSITIIRGVNIWISLFFIKS